MKKASEFLEKVSKSLKNKKVVAITVLGAASLLAAFGARGIWIANQPKFRDVTVELGTDVVKVEQFLTEYAQPNMVSLVTDASEIDLNCAGDTQITLRHGAKEETVVLHVVDTTLPVVDFVKDMTVAADYKFDAWDFVTNVDDFSSAKVAFLGSAAVPVDYSDISVTVEVTDDSGNTVRQNCDVSFTWLKDAVTLEYGDALKPEDLLYLPDRDTELLNWQEIEQINQSGPGKYTVTSTNGGKTLSCEVLVQDTSAPKLVVQNVKRYPGGVCDVKDFVVSYEDASEGVQLRLLTQPDMQTQGIQDIVIEAVDCYGNATRAEAKLSVSYDLEKPILLGLDDLTVEKNSDVDFLEGVSVYDYYDENCTLTVDTSGVNLTSGGIYYAVYTATDASLNTTTVKRRVTVLHDEEDSESLVKSLAAQLSDDPEEIRDYVRRIRYSSFWGGEDPVWHGFTMGSGNCYVHAMCLKALLDEKGYESQIIWTWDESHYWVVVKLGDLWRHIDATPTTDHMIYSLMTDAERLETLGGRSWVRKDWPVCE